METSIPCAPSERTPAPRRRSLTRTTLGAVVRERPVGTSLAEHLDTLDIPPGTLAAVISRVLFRFDLCNPTVIEALCAQPRMNLHCALALVNAMLRIGSRDLGAAGQSGRAHLEAHIRRQGPRSALLTEALEHLDALRDAHPTLRVNAALVRAELSAGERGVYDRLLALRGKDAERDLVRGVDIITECRDDARNVCA